MDDALTLALRVGETSQRLAQLQPIVQLQAERIGELAMLLERTIQRIAMLEVQVHALTEHLVLQDDVAQLPYFQHKPPISEENTPEMP